LIRKALGNGFTLVEMLVVTAIVLILVVVAVPSFVNYVQLNRITVLAQNLYYNLQYARSEAIKRNTTVYVSFTSGSSWCYGINVGSSCTCSTPSSCSLGATSFGSTQATLSSSGLSSNALYFEPNHGASNVAATVSYTITGGTSAVSVEVGLSGSVQTCSNNVSGFQTCT
jgi:type IV fimbrial biogenesis protein FimT